jgi:hypothetical protein
VARSQLGVHESPAGSNVVKYNNLRQGWQGAAWCAAFVSWCFGQVNALALIGGADNYTVSMSKWFRAHGMWHTSPVVGDVVFFNFGAPNGNREHDDLGIHHVGIVEALPADGRIQTIEGNTSTSSDDNGGAVMRRLRSRSGVAGYGRPNYTPGVPVPVVRHRIWFTTPATNPNAVAMTQFATDLKCKVVSGRYTARGVERVAWLTEARESAAVQIVDKARGVGLLVNSRKVTAKTESMDAMLARVKAGTL